MVTDVNQEATTNKTQKSAWWALSRLQLIAVLALIIVASGMRLSIVDRWYPFVDYTDEGVYVAWGMHLRGVSDETALVERWGIVAPAYTPFVVAVEHVFDMFKSYDYILPADYYMALRYTSVVFGVLTALTLMSAVWSVVDWKVGWLVGMIWAISPRIVLYNSLAIPDPMTYWVVALVFLGCILAWQRTSPRWLLVALLSGILIVYLKYWIIFPLLPIVIVGAYLFLQNPRAMRWWALGFVGIAGLSAFVLVVIIDPLNSVPHMGSFTFQELMAQATNPARLRNNLRMTLITFDSGLFWSGVVLAVPAYLLSWRRGWRRVALPIILVTLLYMFAGSFMTAMISNVTGDGRLRNIWPTALGFFWFWGLAVGQILWTTHDWFKARDQEQHQRWVAVAMVAIFAVVMVPPAVTENIENYRSFQREHVVNQLRDWSDDNLPVDGYAMFLGSIRTDLDRVWNRTWGAYIGDRPFVWWTEAHTQISATAPQDYIDRGIYYLTVNEDDLRRVGRSQALLDWMDQLLLIKTFDVDPTTTAGHTTYVYRLIPPEQSADTIFSEQVQLIGYDLNTQTVAAGETLVFRPYWQRVGEIGANYNMFIHLHTADDLAPVAQYDGPLTSIERPTLAWDDPNEVYIGQDAIIALPPDLPTGDYILTVGVYNYETSIRLLDENGESFQVAITVE